jgi:hypothetical protein
VSLSGHALGGRSQLGHQAAERPWSWSDSSRLGNGSSSSRHLANRRRLRGAAHTSSLSSLQAMTIDRGLRLLHAAEDDVVAR